MAIDGFSADGARMLECPACKGQVFLKLLFVGVAGNMRGVVSGMCADCRRGATVTLPEGVQIMAATSAEPFYQQALAQLAQAEPEA